MAEYIEREALVAAFRKDAERLGDIDCPWSPAAIEAEIEAMPAADVAPVVRGHWTRYHEADIGWDEYGYICSNCKFEVEDKDFTFPSNYCPRCGAKMDFKQGGFKHG